MFRKTKLSTGLAIAFGGVMLAGSVQAQDTQRVEITGSAIRRIDAETAVPVTTVKMEDLKAQGVTSVEQALSSLGSVQMQQGVSQTVGSSTGGASFADMRGLGSNKTLILLNGRRVANNAFDGSAPDLNMIPFAAIDRIEVLRDGASSLYGTDAIGGVINFITRKDYTGLTISAGYDKPQHGGGQKSNFNIGFGLGDLADKGFNVWGFVDYEKSKRIAGDQRPYNTGGGLSASPIPANYYQDGSVVGNPAGPSCVDALYGIPADGACYISTAKFVDYTPQVERLSGMLRGTLNLNQDHQLNVEYFLSKSNVQTRIAPVPYGLLYQNPVMPNGQPNPYYPGNNGDFTPAFTPDPTYNGGMAGNAWGVNGTLVQPGYMVVKWRDLFNGPRGDENINTQQRLLASVNGTVANWDYKAGISWNQNKVDEKLISGYNNGEMIKAGVLEGVINPYSLTQTQEALDLINSALLAGTLMSGKATTTTVDASASRELGDWFSAGRPAALALGAEFRREEMHQYAHSDYAALVVASTGVDPATDNRGSRNVEAVFAELAIPVTKTLDATLAARFDKYSDFGSTFNPKASFRWQPAKEVLVRGSVSTGFRAPSLYELYSPVSYTNSSTVDDPVNCPNGEPAPGKTKINNCSAQFQVLNGGNTGLKPEKSKSWTLGVAFEPMRDLSLTADLWWIRMTDQIGVVGDQTLYDPANYALFQQYFHRNGSGNLSTDGTSCPGSDCGYVDVRQQNLGGVNTNGIDFSALYRMKTGYGKVDLSYSSTYVYKYEYQDYAGGPWNQNVAIFSGAGPVFRWQHNASANWSMGAFSAGVAGHYKSGYIDQDPSNRVKSYATMDLYGTWAATKQLSLTLGVRNVFDRDPPYSNQEQVFQAGYDPRYASVEGRAFYVRAKFDL